MKCEECQRECLDWHVHHVDRDRDNNAPKNLKILCPSCHGREHGAEGQSDATIRFGDVYDLMTNKNRVGQRLSYGFSLMGMYE